jgi:hypothetical protein
MVASTTGNETTFPRPTIDGAPLAAIFLPFLPDKSFTEISFLFLGTKSRRSIEHRWQNHRRDLVYLAILLQPTNNNPTPPVDL